MKFKRERTPSHWLSEDIYLRDSWGKPYGEAPPRRFGLRQFFIMAMAVFFLVDLVFAAFFIYNSVSPHPANTAQNNSPVQETNVAFAEATKFAVRSSPTPSPTRRPATRTPIPSPTKPPTAIPPTKVVKQAPVKPTAVQPTQVAIAAPQNIGRIAVPAHQMSVDLPPTLNVGALAVPIPNEPADCTPANAMPQVVTVPIKLCAGQIYNPFTISGQDIGVFGDPSATVRSGGRGFAITIEGARVMIHSVTIRANPDGGDLGILLCLYPDCKGKPGGIVYGGGILVHASDTTIMDSDISGGIAGVAAEHTSGLKLINNHLDNSSGWGSYNFAVDTSYFVGNSWSQDNRSCTAPDGSYLASGCESAGWLCILCQKNIIARNTCTNSGDCYYINGEGNLTSNYNRFHLNECRASPNNCFEVTFSTGNEFVQNVTGKDPNTGEACKYPFWVGGSTVIFSHNTWACTISAVTALRHATDSTSVPTTVQNVQ